MNKEPRYNRDNPARKTDNVENRSSKSSPPFAHIYNLEILTPLPLNQDCPRIRPILDCPSDGYRGTMSSPKRRIETDVMKLMMSDYEVTLVNDNMQEFFVIFKGPTESKRGTGGSDATG